mmetsp:Transcript_23456/g.67591  ORF Transcript_23456/g.67591 Transcript_23456/m.67591 type:complete len:349 (-) Transcript_23456:392-1438(-)
MPRHPTNTKPATMIEEVAIELDAASGSADEAAGHACMCPPRPKSENLPTTSQHQPRRGRRTKPRRNTSITSASTSDVTSDFDLDAFSDSLSTVGDKDNKDTMALSTEVSDDLYFDEIEKLLDDTENTTNANPAPTVSIAAKMQARLLAKHIKTHRLRRVVSHSAATSLQDDVDMLNEASGTGTSSNSTRTGKMRTVFSFGDLRHHDEAEEHQVLTDRILDNVLEDDEEDANVVPSPNDVFEDFDIASEDKSHIKDHHQQPQQQATLKPHPKSMSTCMTPTTVLNDSIGSGSSSRIGYTPPSSLHRNREDFAGPRPAPPPTPPVPLGGPCWRQATKTQAARCCKSSKYR